MNDKELLELAAKACGMPAPWRPDGARGAWVASADDEQTGHWWDPLTDDGDRYRLARALGICIDFEDGCAWKRMHNDAIQFYWGGECEDEAHAVVRVAAEIGRAML